MLLCMQSKCVFDLKKKTCEGVCGMISRSARCVQCGHFQHNNTLHKKHSLQPIQQTIYQTLVGIVCVILIEDLRGERFQFVNNKLRRNVYVFALKQHLLCMTKVHCFWNKLCMNLWNFTINSYSIQPYYIPRWSKIVYEGV